MRYSTTFLRRYFQEMTPRDLGPGFIRTGEHSEEAAAKRLVGMHRTSALMLLPEAQQVSKVGFFSRSTTVAPAERPGVKSDNKFRKD